MMSTDSTQKSGRFSGLPLALAALGVVYGDIGTSPLYALRVCFTESGLPVTPTNVLGIVSLIIWSLLLLITGKYLSLVLRADNKGEGGVLALMALVRRDMPPSGARYATVDMFGLFGAALLYGDGLITPAISVLSAVEGLKVATPVFSHWVLPVALMVLTGLFWVQRRGTHTLGAVFGRIMLLWFAVIAVLGLAQLWADPKVLAAFNPMHGVAFFLENRWHGFLTLGAVFLALTGGEALYADMGHFGRVPIRLGWYTIVLPALLLNYLGQASLLLRDPEAMHSLFYRLAPGWALYPLVGLATVATVIASQAVISGTFSLTRQAVQLGFCPRLEIVHTSDKTIGQVYLPAVNWAMWAGTVALVLGFPQSDRLAGAYGIAVSATMLITSIMIFLVMRWRWGWSLPVAILVSVPFLVVDSAFFASNLFKIKDGGWVPLLMATTTLVIVLIWHQGRGLLAAKFAAESISPEQFLASVAAKPPHRVDGTAVYLTGNRQGIPRTLLHNFKHNKILHRHNVFLTIATEEVPFVPEGERASVEDLGLGFYWVKLCYGFSQDPNVPQSLKALTLPGVALDPMRTTFFLGRETLLFDPHSPMRPWRKRIFSFLSRNAHDASKYFHIPPNRVIEVGIQVQL
jgi:KUP system potassium uptake protein